MRITKLTVKSLLITLLINLVVGNLSAQVAVGSWQEYIALNDVFDVITIDNKVIAAASTGLFMVDNEEGVLTKYTKLNALSDVGITAVCAIPSSNKVIIGYSNGNIDVFKDGTSTNIPDLLNKTLTTSKTINYITVINDLAYCATDFGILVLDYTKNEISDTYYIGEEASDVEVYQIATFNDSIYAATASGVYGAPVDSELLSYYETWENINDDESEYSSVVAFSDSLRTTKVNSNNTVSVKSYKDGNWSTPVGQTYSNFNKWDSNESYISLVTTGTIYNFNSTFSLVKKLTTLQTEDETFTPSYSSVCYLNDEAWIGDSNSGLFKKGKEDYDTQYLPNGPASNNSFKIAASANKLYSVRGISHILTATTYSAEMSIFDNNEWINLTTESDTTLNGKSNLCDIAIDPTDENRVYIASSRSGIFELYNNEFVNYYTENNSTVQNYGSWRIINSVACDENGNLVAANQVNTEYPIVCYQKNSNVWSSFDYQTDELLECLSWINKLISVGNGQFWGITIYPTSGLFIFDTNNELDDSSNHLFRSAETSTLDDRHTTIKLWDDEGDTYDCVPNCLALDKNNYIWVGTDDGPLVYYQPYDAFEDEKPVASRVKIARNDGSGLADYLLASVNITAIAIDGANRKWMGTDGDGVYLISSDGTNNLLHFTVEDSPLLSNTINSIAIDPSSGVVYFATTKGIVSYRGTAIEGKEDYSKVYAYPNPVKPEYEGSITITGLMEESTVKITDVSGKIVYQAVSTGGQLVWDGKNMYNDRVKSGVYLVFATNADGSESVTTKIMIIR